MAVNNKREANFVRDHVKLKLVQAGFDKETADNMVASVTDQEIAEHLPRPTMKGPLQWLKFLKDNKDDILAAIETISALLLLFADKKAPPEPVE